MRVGLTGVVFLVGHPNRYQIIEGVNRWFLFFDILYQKLEHLRILKGDSASLGGAMIAPRGIPRVARCRINRCLDQGRDGLSVAGGTAWGICDGVAGRHGSWGRWR